MRFIFETFEEASNVQKQLFKICREKGYVTCADLFFLTHDDEEQRALISGKKIYTNRGWKNLWQTKVEPCEGYINGAWCLIMPKTIFLKEEGDTNEII